MKDSAAGPDEITAGMMRWACKIPKFRRHFCSAVRSLWVSLPSQWPGMLHQATIVSLWKRKGNPGDLNNHRGICLISLWGRVLGRIVAPRLARYAEQQGILDTTQWGFREARSTHGALAVARRVLDAATRPFGSQVLDPCCVGTSGFEKKHTRIHLGTPFTQ